MAVPAAQADDAGLMAGVWRGQMRSVNGVMSFETIMKRDGTFSSMSTNQTVHGTYAFRVVGRWYVVRPGWYRMHNEDWTPRKFMGNPLHIPATESHQYRFLDQNRILVDESVVMYRVQ